MLAVVLPLRSLVVAQQNSDSMASERNHRLRVCPILLPVQRQSFDFSKHSTHIRSFPCSGIPLSCTDCIRIRLAWAHFLPDYFAIVAEMMMMMMMTVVVAGMVEIGFVDVCQNSSMVGWVDCCTDGVCCWIISLMRWRQLIDSHCTVRCCVDHFVRFVDVAAYRRIVMVYPVSYWSY